MQVSRSTNTIILPFIFYSHLVNVLTEQSIIILLVTRSDDIKLFPSRYKHDKEVITELWQK